MSSKFQFESPNYTQTPNDLFDHLLKQIEDVSELKVTLMAVRMTIGYHRDAAELSIEYLHQSTGLAKNSVRRGLALAIKHGTIRVVKKSTNRTGGIYALNVRVSAADTLEVQPVTPLKKSLNKTSSLSLSESAETKNPTPEPPPTRRVVALETLEKLFFKFGGTLNPALIEKFYLVFDANPDYPAERMSAAINKLEKTRSFFKAIDAYREYSPPAPTPPKPPKPSPAPPRAAPRPPAPPDADAARQRAIAEWKRARLANSTGSGASGKSP